MAHPSDRDGTGRTCGSGCACTESNGGADVHSARRIVFAIAWLVSGLCSYAQLDCSKYVKPVYEGVESTALSIYDTNPESPDGRYVCFVKYPEIARGGHLEKPVKAHVMLKNRATGVVRMIFEVSCNNHNGVNAVWINDSLLAFQVNDFKDFAVYDVQSNRSVFGLVQGAIGHKSFDNLLFFSVCNARLLVYDKARMHYPAEREGIYSLNCITGEITQLVRKGDIIEAFVAQNSNVSRNETKILHVDPNPRNDKIMFDYRYRSDSTKAWVSLHGVVFANGTGARWVRERPMHVVWFDDNSMFGVDTEDREHKIYRYDLYGEKLEMLGGTSTHVGASPDREWYVGESDFYKPEADGFTRVYLYKRGHKKPVALLSEWDNAKITWTWVAHVNPSFSADGKRVYFVRAPNAEERYEAVFIDLAALPVQDGACGFNAPR